MTRQHPTRAATTGAKAAHGDAIVEDLRAANLLAPSFEPIPKGESKGRFKRGRIVLIGDRGMITAARRREDVAPAGLAWITALRAPQIQALAADGGPSQLSLFDARDLAEISSPDYPGERLIVCRNPALAEERARKRSKLLDATEAELCRIQERGRRAKHPLHGAAAIGLGGRRRARPPQDGQALPSDDHRQQPQFCPRGSGDRRRSPPRRHLYPAHQPAARAPRRRRHGRRLSAPRPRRARLFAASKASISRCGRSSLGPESRVRAHVFLCLLAYHREWHMRQALAPILFDDHDHAAAEAQPASPVAKPQVSPAACRKTATKRSAAGEPVLSFRSLLRHLATLTRNTVRLTRDQTATLYSPATPLQKRAFERLAIPQPA